MARNCNAPLDSVKGAEGKDWQGGKPVRVVRNCKGRKHSQYAPEEGNRYDGIYKVIEHLCVQHVFSPQQSLLYLFFFVIDRIVKVLHHLVSVFIFDWASR